MMRKLLWGLTARCLAQPASPLPRSRRRARRRRRRSQQTAQAAAPIDFTGTWASVVTEDWQWRFVTPIVGDYTGVPLNSVGDKLARSWNPDADVKAGEQCKGFGAAAINRLPTRLQIAWQDDNTLKLDFDLGTQSRLVYFDKSKAAGERSWQGHAIGEWIDLPAAGGRGGGGGGNAGRAGAPRGRGCRPGRCWCARCRRRARGRRPGSTHGWPSRSSRPTCVRSISVRTAYR